MLRNMKLGTKLLAVILPPLIVLVVVAGIGALDRLDEAADARSADQYIALADASSASITTLQWERSLSLYLLAGGETDVEANLVERRARVDAEWDRFEAAADELTGGDPDHPLAELISDAAANRSRIASFRGSIDSGTTGQWIIAEGFDRATSAHLDLIGEIANSVPIVEVSSELASFSAVVQAQEAASRTAAPVTMAIAEGSFDAEGRAWRAMMSASTSFERYESLFYDLSPAVLESQLRGALGSGDPQAAERMRREIVDTVAPSINWLTDGSAFDEPESLADFDPVLWIDLSESRQGSISGVGSGILADVSAFVSGVRDDAEQAALFFLLAAAAAVLFSGIMAVIVARRVTKPLRELTVAADRLSDEQLPALVERLRNPSEEGTGVLLEPIGMRRNDEIGHLADAFDAIQRVTVDVAEEQSNLLRKGIGDIFVNLARRNQTLLDRQIEFIDQLESSEEDPDVLENLFKLDHLATRMRRNAESLLVLAGVETGHRRSKPVPLADVVRVAIGEVEDFARLSLVALDDAKVTGSAAMDVAHLLSELMENATAFSPPETNVEILGHQSADGYVLSISDQGIGMSEEQFAEANRLLADPPLVGLTLSRSLGFTVVGRLASRFDISVRLTSSPTGGVTALVTLPAPVLHALPEARVPAEPEAVSDAAAPTEPAPPSSEPGTLPRREPNRGAATAFAPQPIPDDSITEPEPVAEASSPAWAESEPVAESPSPTFAEPEPVAEAPSPAFAEPDPVAEAPSPAFADPFDAPRRDPGPAMPRPDEPAPDWVSPAPAAGSLASAVPEGDAFDQGLAALMGGEATERPATDNGRDDAVSGEPEPSAPSLFGAEPVNASTASSDAAGDAAGGVTSAGLARRVPKANIPVSEPVERPGSSAGSSVGASQRSPEEVRAMLSRYRSGLQRATGTNESDDPGTPGSHHTNGEV